MVEPRRIVVEVDQPIAIINFDIKQSQHLESKDPRYFSPGPAADITEVKSDQVFVVLSYVSETDNGPFCPEDLVHLAGNSLNFHQGIVVNVCYLPGGRNGNLVVEPARVEKEKPRRGVFIAHIRVNQQLVVEAVDLGKGSHFGSDVAILGALVSGRFAFVGVFWRG